MQKGHQLEFACISCQTPVTFSIFELDKRENAVVCSACGKEYHLEDETLRRQLKKFEALCRQLLESEEILADTAVGINVGDQSVKVPFRLLLTRFNSSINLMIGDHPLSITFRLEPSKDLPGKLI